MKWTRQGKLVKAPIYGLMLVLLLVGSFVQMNQTYPFWRKNYMPKVTDLGQLTGEQLLFAFAGFREMIAGILWVRADSFFDNGDYDSILPIIRLVTYLDPKQIDVYATGMWHIAYNFTDQENRADRRNIPIAVAFGEEGARNNDYTYELFYETGWLWYHRIQDNFPMAVTWFEQAAERKDILPARHNLLSHAKLRAGDYKGALNTWYELLEAAEKEMERNKSQRSNYAQRDTVEGNLDNLLIRLTQRGYFARENGWYDQGNYDTKPPFDVRFSASVTVTESRVMLVEGTWNVFPVGTRVRMILRDADYPNAKAAGLDWEGGDANNFTAPAGLTYVQDELFVRNRRFRKAIDLSRDPTIYPFVKDKYILEFYYTPRVAPEHIKDKFGYNGEGMTDSNFLNTEIRENQRVIYWKTEVTRDQILRRGEYGMEGTIPVFKTPNYVAPRVRNPEDDLVSPGTRRVEG